MIFSKIMKGIKEAFIVSGYSRTAIELRNLSDSQLADIGVSRELLLLGAKGYPWRDEKVKPSTVIPSNVTKLKAKKVIENTPIMPHTPKAA